MAMIGKKLMTLAVAAALGGFASAAFASGFALIEQNVSGLGNAYAGQAASAQDASTIYFNPAGMTRLPGKNLVVAGHLISPSAKFNNTGTTAAVSTVLGAGPYALNGEGGDAGHLAFVPNAYLSWQLNPQWYVGVGMNAPFGMATEYDANWMGRFHALKSELKAVNINPSVAFKLNDSVSFGFGVNWQRVEAELTKAVNYSFIASAGGIGGVPNNSEGSNKIEGDDDAWGYNLGVMFKVGPNTDIGLSYRSAMKYTLSGSVAFFGRPAAVEAAVAASAAAANQAGDSPMTADLELPASASLGIFHKLNPQWDFLADITWAQWSSLQTLDIVRNTGFVLESTPFRWRDTWRVGVGASYRPNREWTVRLGVAYDETPTSDTYRTPRVPDQNRTWLAIGGQYRLSSAGAIDFGYAHLFVDDAAINMSGPPSLTAAQAAGRGNLVGNFNNKVDIFSIQYRHSF